jgi:hypothetical protein
MSEREERLEAALQRIVQWSDAYPLDIAPRLTWREVEEVLDRRVDRRRAFFLHKGRVCVLAWHRMRAGQKATTDDLEPYD